MLFAKSISNLNFEDVEEFCPRFHEDIRVEYKSTFDNSVKAKLPRVLSSFANSYGGILIIGIDAPAGVPRRPYDGIVFPEREPGLTFRKNNRSEEHTSELQSHLNLVCRLLLEKKKSISYECEASLQA